MKVQLKYEPATTGQVGAAFLRGSGPMAWMHTISQWDTDPDSLEYYILCENTGNIAGLFVIFDNEAQAGQLQLLEPFCRVAGKLFIPQHTGIFPAISETELSTLLIWHRQVLHPALGFTGFEKSDQLLLSDLFSFPEPVMADWSFAHPGVPALPGFQSIRIQQPSTIELLEEIRKAIGEEPLENIRKDDTKPGFLKKLLLNILFYLLKGTMLLALLLSKLRIPIPSLTSGGGSATGMSNRNTGASGNPKTGLLDRLNNWLDKHLAELEKRREKEISRLLSMFDKNKDEALKYAIPLNSPYLNRGRDRSSGSLTRGSGLFNLNWLGGGGARDVWNIGPDKAELLRLKYLKAATEAFEQKDFRKAAY
ncbi:MAG: hypothetical protein J7578_10250, partial [Chitinophagaceae bacterium]|nr:hypothetical protein [Chitinophagaceae bacterium]